MEFEWGLMRNYLGAKDKEDAIVSDDGDGTMFVLPEKGKVLKREEYSSGFARQRFLERACQAGLSASRFIETLEQNDLSGPMKREIEKLLRELISEQRTFEILAEALEEF